MREILTGLATRLQYGEEQHHRNLSVLPILGGTEGGPDYLSLTEALERELAEITEVSESGSVPNLKVTNRADEPLLLIDGEELVGAKQNRIVNTSLLLAAHSETDIPVSCTEQGRWAYTDRKFRDSGVVMSSKSRYQKARRMYQRMKTANAYDTVQSEVWGDVRELHDKYGTHSRTSAMRDAYEQKQKDMEAYLQAFPRVEGQTGLMVLLNGKLLGVDYVSSPRAYSFLHEKLVRSHVLEALGEPVEETNGSDRTAEARTFLEKLAKAPEATQHQPVGLGVDYRYDSEQEAGALLAYEEAPVHLTAFEKTTVDGINRDGKRRGRSRRWGLSDRMDRRRSREDRSGQAE